MLATPCRHPARAVPTRPRSASHSTPPAHPFKAVVSGQRKPAGQGAAAGPAAALGHLAVVLLPLAMYLIARLCVGAAADLCDGLQIHGSVRLRADAPEDGVTAQEVPLAEFQYDELRKLVESDFQLRRGPGPLDFKFRPRVAATGLGSPAAGSWARGRLVGATAKARLGRQRFELAATPEGCPGAGVPFSGHLVVLAAFEEEYNCQPCAGVGSWWIISGDAIPVEASALGLPLREALRGRGGSSPGDLGALVRQKLWAAYADGQRFPKIA